MDIAHWLQQSLTHQASDLHLSAGLPPMIRVHGDMQRLDAPALTAPEVQALIQATMDEAQHAQYTAQGELDYALDLEGLGRFRVNAFTQQRGAAAAFRTIAAEQPSLAQCGAPPVLADLALKPRGLVLVTGPTGSGKSTTLAAMVAHRNQHSSGHIITVEDPIECVHTSARCLIHQREVGRHTDSFAAALRAALREDPDVIVVGELRDLETIRLALTAAETGHLVLGTLHTASAPKTINRIIDVFPAAEKDMARAMLAESLQAVVTQTLCKRLDGQGRVAVHEILLGTPAIRNLIREGKVAQMHASMQTGASAGMQTLDQSLQEAVRRQRISAEEARRHAQHGLPLM